MAQKKDKKAKRSPGPEAMKPVPGAHPSAQTPDASQERVRQAASAAAEYLRPAPTAPPSALPKPKPVPTDGEPKTSGAPSARTQPETRPPASTAAAPVPSEAVARRPGANFASPPASQRVTPEKTTPSTPTPANVTFVLHAPEAQTVSLCGEFNSWSANATPMKRQSDGRWETTLALKPGRYQYKFLVDTQWVHDPNARENVPNEHGSLNSIVEVRS